MPQVSEGHSLPSCSYFTIKLYMLKVTYMGNKYNNSTTLSTMTSVFMC